MGTPANLEHSGRRRACRLLAGSMAAALARGLRGAGLGGAGVGGAGLSGAGLWAAARPARAETATGATLWAVGPGLPLRSVAEALRRARDGDTITVAPGTYRGDVAVIHQRRLTIRGLGQRPLMLADGRHAEGKAIWVVRDGDLRIENIAFQGARVPDGNGAAIRFERGRLALRGCLLADHQMGLLTGNDGRAELLVEDCEFRDAPPPGASLPHLLYAGRIARLTVRGSRFSRGFEGHLIKSRAAETVIEHNHIDDGPTGQASYEIDLPNGGLARVAHNRIGQAAGTRNPVMLSFGAEGQAWPRSGLQLLDNQFVNRAGAARGVPVRVWADRLPPGTPVLSRHNRWLGGGTPVLGPQADRQGDDAGPLPAE
ncbi:hypothetical protein [Aquabacterium sp. OR-4]|uniref:hypothetical protein n=1 Tax=Aquabacterium sp. OR-4 TaxID=2978127 RepID=UPI0028C6EF5D|nr:hypothetical protein [Aquabacterium sp. OR-4]MDT7837554.1 hypothetical protein [Aquabacterium sp. OR-4]